MDFDLELDIDILRYTLTTLVLLPISDSVCSDKSSVVRRNLVN